VVFYAHPSAGEVFSYVHRSAPKHTMSNRIPTARKQMSAFMDDFADIKECISISFYMISRDEPKSQRAEKKAHLYETTECYVAEDASDPNQLVELAKETIFGSELNNLRLCKLSDAKDLFIVPRKFYWIESLGQPVDLMDLIQLLVSAMSIPRAINYFIGRQA
jgi:hypothetical protein